jgi:hypothetical protein
LRYRKSPRAWAAHELRLDRACRDADYISLGAR